MKMVLIYNHQNRHLNKNSKNNNIIDRETTVLTLKRHFIRNFVWLKILSRYLFYTHKFLILIGRHSFTTGCEQILWSKSKYLEISCGRGISKLRENCVKPGQIISIDNNTTITKMKLYFLLSGMITSLKCMGKNNNSLWDTHYIWASNYISSHDGNLKIYSTTSSFNSNGIGFTYLFQEKDIVNGLSFELDKGKVGKPKQKGGEHSEIYESQWFPFDNEFFIYWIRRERH